MSSKKAHIESFDFIRSVTAWIIIIYHFANLCTQSAQHADFPFLLTHANGVWGENTSVNIFFILSGASLYYNHPDFKEYSLKRYYFDRFKGIFPMFYMLWFFLFYQRAAALGNLFYNGSPKYLLLTLFGMDGYFFFRFPQSYYIIGEWFLGALILLYILYPLLTWCMRHCKILTTVVLGAGTLAFHWQIPFFQIPREHNLIVCLFAFWLGMIFMEYRDILSAKWITMVFGGIALILIFIKMPFDSFLCTQLIAVGLFLLFYHLGSIVMRFRHLHTFFAYTSRNSYAIFLLQHVTIGQVLGFCGAYALSVGQEVLVLGVVFAMIYLFSDISTRLNRMFLKSRCFQKFEHLLFGE